LVTLPQIDPQVISLSVRKYLERNRALSGDLAVQDSQLKDLTAYMGMSPYLDRPVKQLSLGLRQRVGFLAAVVIRPNILILDEPFSFQNGRHISNMLDIIQDLKNHDAGVILASATQDNSALKLFDKTYLLKNKNLSKLNSNKNGDSCILIFNIKNDSMAITKDLKNYLLTNVNNVIELKVPTIIKDSVIKEMISLNYNFEGARIIEN
jgi:ABC-type multidrug transport system, ATPase component